MDSIERAACDRWITRGPEPESDALYECDGCGAEIYDEADAFKCEITDGIGCSECICECPVCGCDFLDRDVDHVDPNGYSICPYCALEMVLKAFEDRKIEPKYIRGPLDDVALKYMKRILEDV